MRLAEHFLGQKRLIQLDCILCTLPLLSRGSGVRIPPGSPVFMQVPNLGTCFFCLSDTLLAPYVYFRLVSALQDPLIFFS